MESDMVRYLTLAEVYRYPIPEASPRLPRKAKINQRRVCGLSSGKTMG